MMKEIGREMHQATKAFAVLKSAVDNPKILDMCMAPGGFLETALGTDYRASAVAFSLPESNGGHKVLLRKSHKVVIKYLDVTMLASDVGETDIPTEHPLSQHMLPQQLDSAGTFDLVVCDGQILRNYDGPAIAANRQARRLTVSQLAIGLRHVKIGGTMVVLLHKVEALNTATLLHSFSKFSTVTLFKPTKHHAKRSSFYMVATDVHNDHPEAVLAMTSWKTQWRVATFGPDEEYDEGLQNWESDANTLIDEFGGQLVQMGREIWATQARALEKAPFIRNKA
jgi:23S rRNA U2552 (ribose-2'-O)-methylase RlmE/FtsJ